MSFPAVRYHPELGKRTVDTFEQETALGRGWYDTPDFANGREVNADAFDVAAVPVADTVDGPADNPDEPEEGEADKSAKSRRKR